MQHFTPPSVPFVFSHSFFFLVLFSFVFTCGFEQDKYYKEKVSPEDLNSFLVKYIQVILMI